MNVPDLRGSMLGIGDLPLIGLAVVLLVALVRLAGKNSEVLDGHPLAHLAELRSHVMKMALIWLVASMLLFVSKLDTLYGWTILVPAMQDSLAAQVFEALANHAVPSGVELVTTAPLHGFIAQFTLALGMGFVLVFPVLAAHLGAFFGPALKPEERQVAKRLLVPSCLCFLLGAWFGYALILPFMLGALYGYGSALGATSLLAVSDLVSFTVTTLIVFGLAFQTPLVMMALSRFGLVPAHNWRKWWKFALVGSFILGAITTDPSVVSQLLVAGPIVLLYIIGALGAKLLQQKATK